MNFLVDSDTEGPADVSNNSNPADEGTFMAASAAGAPADPPVPPNIGVSNTSASSSSTSQGGITLDEVVLWPFDRGESRGKLKVVTMRIGVDELLTLSYRQVALRSLG